MTTETANRILHHRDPKGAIFFQPEFEELMPMAKLWLMLPEIQQFINGVDATDYGAPTDLLDRLKALEDDV